MFGRDSDFETWTYNLNGMPTSMHLDDSDFTLNFCLGPSFKGKFASDVAKDNKDLN
jgi:hypothetical protein